MKERAIYWRRKEGRIIAEGKQNGKTIYLFQLPDIEKLIKSSYFTPEKREKIMKKISRLDYKQDKTKKEDQEVHTTQIMRTSEKDDTPDPDDYVNEFMEAWGLKKDGEEQ